MNRWLSEMRQILPLLSQLIILFRIAGRLLTLIVGENDDEIRPLFGRILGVCERRPDHAEHRQPRCRESHGMLLFS
jgi:hypothetical protein